MGKFIPYGRQYIDNEDIQVVIDVLRSDFLTQGPNISKLEKFFSKEVHSNYSVAFNSATSALHIACLALGLNEDNYLWTTPITFVASANCGLYCGAKVDFVDIDPKTGLMCTNKLKNKLIKAEKEGKLPKIIIPVHLAGTSCDMPKIKELSLKYGFSIIEDASHALGGSCNNFKVGSCRYSDITVFSLHPVKIITSGEGGVATTNDKEIAKKLSLLRSHGIEKKRDLFNNPDVGEWVYEQQELGFNYRMTDILAALGISQLKKLSFFVEKRNSIIEKYKDNFKNLPFSLLEVPKNIYSSYHLAIVRLNNKNKDHHREVFNKLRESNIGVQVHYTPVHLHPFYQKKGFNFGDFPNSEQYASNAISLPIFPAMTDKEFETIISTLEIIFK
tara:strand:- start:1220 stop:2383 length:1164 start_codon:yes stop_codon:yes gene_type:complete